MIAKLKSALIIIIMTLGMPAVQLYLDICESVFLNTAAEDGNPLEYTGNLLLSPLQYLLDGKVAIRINDIGPDQYALFERFDYENNWQLKTIGSLFALPYTTLPGILIKATGYLNPNVAERHNLIKEAIKGGVVKPKYGYYHSLGITWDELDHAKPLPPPMYLRRPGDEDHLFYGKEALKEIVKLLNEAYIPWWADVGTTLGAYRYGGVIPWDNDIDIAILNPDFHNVKKILGQLDSNKYIVQDWSSRSKPGTYLKVYVKENASIIDIYNYAIDKENKTLNYILSNEDNIFLPESWKIRERRYKKPVPISMIFPLKRANFDGIEVFVPNKTIDYLKLRYGENLEPNMIYDKKQKRYVKDLDHPYWKSEVSAFPATSE